MPYILYTDKMLNRIAHLYMDGKTVPQITGVMTIEYGTRRMRFSEKDVDKQLEKMDFNSEDVLTSKDQHCNLDTRAI